jgi:hypothetical protein
MGVKLAREQGRKQERQMYEAIEKGGPMKVFKLHRNDLPSGWFDFLADVQDVEGLSDPEIIYYLIFHVEYYNLAQGKCNVVSMSEWLARKTGKDETP